MTVTFDGIRELTKLSGQGLGGTTFDEMALGTDATAPDMSQSGLLAEISTGGGARKTNGDVTTSVETNASTGDMARWLATWTFTNAFGINEFSVENSAGIMLLRQVFASVFNVFPLDVFQLQVDLISEDEVVASDSVLTFTGLAELNHLIVPGGTPSGRFLTIANGGS